MTSPPNYVAEFLDRDATERFAGVLRRRGVSHVVVVPDGDRPGAW